MISIIAEHSIDISLLKEKSKILDLGCRGFAFVRYLEKLGHYVCPVDIDNLPDKSYLKCAIGGENKMVAIDLNESDHQATKIREAVENDEKEKLVQMFTVKMLTDLINDQGRIHVKYWDVIKFDIEGAEYQAILAMKEPMGKQLSVEFHLHTGIYAMPQVTEIVDHLKSLGYTAVQHEMSSQHGLPPNYWDSLFIYNL